MVQELDSGKLMYSVGNNDECYTPDYGVKPILKYIPKDAIVWCPFDTIDSEFTRQISKQNKVISSHLDNGKTFYNGNQKNIGILSYQIHHLVIKENFLREHYHLANPLP